MNEENKGLSPVKLSALIAAACFLYFHFVSLGTPGRWFAFSNRFYNLQTDAFLRGELDLSVVYDQRVLENSEVAPLDEFNRYILSSGIHDLSYYRGKLFSYFGLAPCLVFYLPYRILTAGKELPDAVAIVLLCLGTLFWSMALLMHFKKRYFHDTPEWMLMMTFGVIAFGNLTPFLARSFRVYEIAVAAGLFFTTGAAYLFCRAFSDPEPSAVRLGLGSLFLGLAVGSRPNTLLIAVIFLAVAFWHFRPQKSAGPHSGKTVLALGAPFFFCLCLWLGFNALRFQDPFEFGLSYQIAWHHQHTVPVANDLSRVFSNGYFYLLQAPKMTSLFPYVHLEPRSPAGLFLPAGGPYGIERVAGLLASVPFLFLFFFFPFIFWALKSKGPGALRENLKLVWRTFIGTALYYYGMIFLTALFKPFNNIPVVAEGVSFLTKATEQVPLAVPFFVIGLILVVRRTLERSAGDDRAIADFPRLAFLTMLSAAAAPLFFLMTWRYLSLRHLADVATLFILSACVLWFNADRRLAKDLISRSLLRVIGGCLAGMSIFFGLMFAARGYYQG